jgi:hypothetical protein
MSMTSREVERKDTCYNIRNINQACKLFVTMINPTTGSFNDSDRLRKTDNKFTAHHRGVLEVQLIIKECDTDYCGLCKTSS